MKNEHAVALGRLGGRRGGAARADKLTARERTAIARQAACTRWQGVTDERLAVRVGHGRQTCLPKFLYGVLMRGDDPAQILLPRDLNYVIARVLAYGIPKQKVWLLRRFGREEIVRYVRQCRGAFLQTKEQLLEWVSAATAWRWLRQRAVGREKARSRATTFSLAKVKRTS